MAVQPGLCRTPQDRFCRDVAQIHSIGVKTVNMHEDAAVGLENSMAISVNRRNLDAKG